MNLALNSKMLLQREKHNEFEDYSQISIERTHEEENLFVQENKISINSEARVK